MNADQQSKLDAINKILSVAVPELKEATVRAEEWSRDLAFKRRTEEILTADAAAKQATTDALKKVSEDVLAGKL